MMISGMTGLQPAARARERGVTLVIALIFMVALTLLGVGMIKSTTSEERMGANTRDYDLAFASAEAALRDAEIRLQGTYSYPSSPIGPTNFPAGPDACGTAITGTASQIGLCTDVASQPIFTNTTFALDDAVHAAVLGRYTNTPSIQGVSSQPRYYIETVQIKLYGSSATTTNAYRITSKGYGARGTTQVLLQELFLK